MCHGYSDKKPCMSSANLMDLWFLEYHLEKHLRICSISRKNHNDKESLLWVGQWSSKSVCHELDNGGSMHGHQPGWACLRNNIKEVSLIFADSMVNMTYGNIFDLLLPERSAGQGRSAYHTQKGHEWYTGTLRRLCCLSDWPLFPWHFHWELPSPQLSGRRCWRPRREDES